MPKPPTEEKRMSVWAILAWTVFLGFAGVWGSALIKALIVILTR